MKTRMLVASLALVCSSTWAQTCVTNQPLFQEEGQLIDLENGTVLDVKSNLLWSKCTLGQTYNQVDNSCSNGGATSYTTWQEALQATETPVNTTVGTITGFRLPNIKELTSIVNYQCVFPAVDEALFPSTENEPYWTNTPDAPRSGAQINTGLNGLVINFATGEEFIDQDRDRILIRLVKDYQ